MRLLVTGSQGFLGAHLTEQLRRKHPGARLFRLTRFPSDGAISCDLRNVEETTAVLRRVRPTHLFHLAGQGVSRMAWETLWSAHLDATRGLLESVLALRDSGRIRIVFAGSAGEYGFPEQRGPVLESAPLEPATEAGSITRAQFLLASSYRHRGLSIIWARIFNVLGPGMPDSLAIGTFARQIARVEQGRQREIRVGNLDSKRDYVDVRDVARALDVLALRGAPGEAYNVCSGRSRSMSQLLRRMIGFSGARVPVRRDVARVRRGEVKDVYGSTRKLSALGWRPKIGIDESIRDTLQWHRDHA